MSPEQYPEPRSGDRADQTDPLDRTDPADQADPADHDGSGTVPALPRSCPGDGTATDADAPTGPHRSYRHEALLYSGQAEFLSSTSEFVLGGVEAGQPVMVAVAEPKLTLLRTALGTAAEHVTFVDMGELGANPARIIPGWQDFVTSSPGPIRGVGEPIWAGRSTVELVEAQLHEALLNVAIAPDVPLWLMCPYDVDSLEPAVIEEAGRSHPVLVDSASNLGSRSYGGTHHINALFRAPLESPDVDPDPWHDGTPAPFQQPCTDDVQLSDHGPRFDPSLRFDHALLPEVHSLVLRTAVEGGLTAARARVLGAVMMDIADESVRYGGGGTLRAWSAPGAVICEIQAPGRLDDPLVGRRSEPAGRGRGVWLANQVCDLAQVRTVGDTVLIRVHCWH